MDESILEVLTEEQLTEYISTRGVLLVDFFASWCAPCMRLMKILPRLADEFKDVTIIKVNVDTLGNLADQNNIKIVPTFILYRNGVQVDRWEGIRTLEQMGNSLRQHS